MNISPNEAEEALAAIQKTAQKARQSFAASGSYVFLLITGIIWLVGFLANQFLTGPVVPAIWGVVSVSGSILSIALGRRLGGRVRSPAMGLYTRRLAVFWVLLVLLAAAAIAVAHPTDGRQVTMLVILFIMIGQLAMSLLFSFAFSWWAVPVAALALAGYFLLPAYFYLWMALLGGGTLIALALYIRSRW